MCHHLITSSDKEIMLAHEGKKYPCRQLKMGTLLLINSFFLIFDCQRSPRFFLFQVKTTKLKPCVRDLYAQGYSGIAYSMLELKHAQYTRQRGRVGHGRPYQPGNTIRLPKLASKLIQTIGLILSGNRADYS